MTACKNAITVCVAIMLLSSVKGEGFEGGWTMPASQYDPWSHMSGCERTMAGCTANFHMNSHEINGTVLVIDDCTFLVNGWQFDGLGLPVEWWAAQQEGDATVFPYPANARPISSLGQPGNYTLGATSDFLAALSGLMLPS
jgi:hypothetical protein